MGKRPLHYRSALDLGRKLARRKIEAPDLLEAMIERVETIDQASYRLQSRERDPLIARWDHLVSIKPLDESRSLYRDTIEIDAGKLTFIVWAWANWFYRHRQRRWRALAKSL